MHQRRINVFKNKTILVTGSAGFIGYSLVKKLLLEHENCVVVGLDNCNDYYDISIKKYIENCNMLKNRYSESNTFTTVSCVSCSDVSYSS